MCTLLKPYTHMCLSTYIETHSHTYNVATMLSVDNILLVDTYTECVYVKDTVEFISFVQF